jgi:hypothetical protein
MKSERYIPNEMNLKFEGKLFCGSAHKKIAQKLKFKSGDNPVEIDFQIQSSKIQQYGANIEMIFKEDQTQPNSSPIYQIPLAISKKINFITGQLDFSDSATSSIPLSAETSKKSLPLPSSQSNFEKNSSGDNHSFIFSLIHINKNHAEQRIGELLYSEYSLAFYLNSGMKLYVKCSPIPSDIFLLPL